MKSEQQISKNGDSTAIYKIRKRNKKATKVLLLLIVVYGLTTIPSRIYLYISRHFFVFELTSDSIRMNYKNLLLLEHVAYLLLLLNNVVNFVVYAYMIIGFRRFMFKCLTFGCYGRKVIQRHSSSVNNKFTLRTISWIFKTKNTSSMVKTEKSSSNL